MKNISSDGTRTYAYDAANHLTVVSGSGYSYHYIYNGLGDRLQSTLNGVITDYTLDLNRSLTQVLSDGTNIYTYGLNRIAQMNDSSTGYFLTDALGSVRQVASDTTIPTDEAGSVIDPEIVLSRSYSPYGETISSNGDFATDYGYTGEMTDDTGMVNLRARWYDPGTGRFLTKDSWSGDYENPITLGKWLYANANPVMYTDPTGNCYTNPNIFSSGYWERFWDSPILGPCSSNSTEENEGLTKCTQSPFPNISVEKPSILPPEESFVVINYSEGESQSALYVGLGTILNNKHTIVTAKHVIPSSLSNAAIITIGPMGLASSMNNVVKYKASTVKLKYESDRDMVTLSLPKDLQGEVVPAKTSATYQYKKDDLLTMVSQHGTSFGELRMVTVLVAKTGLFNTTVEGQSAIVALANDPNNFMRGGDSGGGVFYNGQYVGLNTGTASTTMGQMDYITPYSVVVH